MLKTVFLSHNYPIGLVIVLKERRKKKKKKLVGTATSTL
jgi:hypothetical protein